MIRTDVIGGVIVDDNVVINIILIFKALSISIGLVAYFCYKTKVTKDTMEKINLYNNPVVLRAIVPSLN
jgi:hypothetical protein